MTLYNRTIKHKKNMDIAYLVLKCFDTGTKLKLKVDVINQGYIKSWPLNIKLNITIEKAHLDDWLFCKNSNALCLRYETWEPIK